MSRLRTLSDRQVDTAIEDLITVLSTTRGMSVELLTDDRVTASVGRQSWTATVIPRANLSLLDVQELVSVESRCSKIIVANQLSAEAKDFLTEVNAANDTSSWSWLDRRGELALNHSAATGVVHFTGTAPSHDAVRSRGWGLASPRSGGPIRGRAGMSYAAALLIDPNHRPSIREVAASAGMSHGAIGSAAKLLRDSGLIKADGGPEIPDLFEALADVWGPTSTTPLVRAPTKIEVERMGGNSDDLDQTGWALGGDDAALSWGAPMFVGNSRPWIWVPTDADARRVIRILGTAGWDDAEVVLAVAPTQIMCATRLQAPRGAEPTFLPTIHPLFLALKLAQDRGRGREILDGWTPDHSEIRRVW